MQNTNCIRVSNEIIFGGNKSQLWFNMLSLPPDIEMQVDGRQGDQAEGIY